MASGTGRVSIADVRHDWFVVDAADQVLGRLATRVARILSGKHRRNYVPYLDMENGIPIKVFNMKVQGNIQRVVLGEDIGSLVSADAATAAGTLGRVEA